MDGAARVVDDRGMIAPVSVVEPEPSIWPNAQRFQMITMTGDSMAPVFHAGDKLVVDTGDKTPSPPGVFVIFDGLGLVPKRIEHLPNSRPAAVRVSAENPRYRVYEDLLAKVRICGRIVGKWSPLGVAVALHLTVRAIA